MNIGDSAAMLVLQLSCIKPIKADLTPQGNTMTLQFATLSHIPLQSGAHCQQPRALSLDDPAQVVMTDFHQVRPITTFPETLIEDALEKMKTKGVRLLLVIGEDSSVIGLITATDIQGEKPIQLVRDTGTPHSQLTVVMLMTPLCDIKVLSMTAVGNARIGHILTTLRQLERQHTLVVDVDKDSGKQSIRGLFSSSQISKQLGMEVGEVMTAAHSLAEIQQELA